MGKPGDFRKLTCAECANGVDLGFDFTMAFQPIVDAETRGMFAHEALVRGRNGEGAGSVFAHVNDANRYRFDQSCRTKAIKLAAAAACPGILSINFMPKAVYRPELCIRTTLEAATTYGFALDRIMFEITEGEKVEDIPHVRSIIQHYKERSFKTAIDDFGAGYAGLNLLAELQTDYIKLDMELTRGIDSHRPRQSIVRSILMICRDLHIRVIAEGIESWPEYATLRDMGVGLFQGYYFAKPALERFDVVAPERFNAP